MAKKKSDSLEQSPESSTIAEKNSSNPTKGKMVLRVRPPRQLNAQNDGEEEQSSLGKKRKTTSFKKASKIDSKMPKKPPTAFFFFLEDFRKEFQENNPDVKTMRDIGKACGEKWKTMTYEEKVQYYDIATEKRREFDRAVADFKKRKENGEFQEYEDDSDFDD